MCIVNSKNLNLYFRYHPMCLIVLLWTVLYVSVDDWPFLARCSHYDMMGGKANTSTCVNTERGVTPSRAVSLCVERSINLWRLRVIKRPPVTPRVILAITTVLHQQDDSRMDDLMCILFRSIYNWKWVVLPMRCHFILTISGFLTVNDDKTEV